MFDAYVGANFLQKPAVRPPACSEDGYYLTHAPRRRRLPALLPSVVTIGLLALVLDLAQR